MFPLASETINGSYDLSAIGVLIAFCTGILFLLRQFIANSQLGISTLWQSANQTTLWVGTSIKDGITVFHHDVIIPLRDEQVALARVIEETSRQNAVSQANQVLTQQQIATTLRNLDERQQQVLVLLNQVLTQKSNE
jgi:hypothetical protein